ncbi:RidA family protein [Lachnotalea sp. AF33-28]|uniref:RidA family protein n=1 Tax=Lachnotalea sp. AF33-28 TaxID=2292046 RepID=UPI000E4B2BF5|nr:RidA family protein [Lachnotalea sp. AF33-28]RHP35679.1 RidA family protein [Lachnotalea sp. AF33-28]
MDTINRVIENSTEIELKFKQKRGIILLRQVDNLIFVSGHGPEDQITGKPLYQGRVGAELSLEEGYAAARECAVILLGALKDYLGSLDRLEGIVKAFGLVNCAEGFTDVDQVMDGFSDTVADVLEERGYHARTGMGTHNLPNGNIPVEIEVIAAVRA